MLENIPSQSIMTELLGKPLYEVWQALCSAIDEKYDAMGDFELVDELSRIANVAVPKAIEEIRTAPVLHNTVCDKEDMKSVVMRFLGV